MVSIGMHSIWGTPEGGFGGNTADDSLLDGLRHLVSTERREILGYSMSPLTKRAPRSGRPTWDAFRHHLIHGDTSTTWEYEVEAFESDFSYGDAGQKLVHGIVQRARAGWQIAGWSSWEWTETALLGEHPVELEHTKHYAIFKRKLQ